eukprot:INCI9921.4.p1 GENE.INCI9921.4~~INCI9921.4.p1  ORF type:complete len:532 (-),score=84.63 INCI9921.4:1536-2951(-)
MSLHELDILDEPTVETSSADQASLFPFDESLLDLSDDEECPNSLTIDGIQANLAESGSGGGPCLPDDIAQIESLTFPSPKNAVGLLGNAHPGTGLDGASRKSAEGDSPTWTLRPQTSSKLPIKKLRGGSALEVVCPTLCNTNMVVCGAVSTVPLATDTEQACAAMTQVFAVSQQDPSKIMWSFSLTGVVQRMRYVPGQNIIFIAAGKALHSVRATSGGVSESVHEAKPRAVARLSDHARDFCVGHSFVAAGGYAETVQIFDLRTSAAMKSIPVHGTVSSMCTKANDCNAREFSWTTDDGHFQLYDDRSGAIELEYQVFWASDAEVYAHGYIGTNQVIIAGQHGVKTVVDIRKRATSAHMQHDASRIRHTSQDRHVRNIGGVRIHPTRQACAFFGERIFSVWSYLEEDDGSTSQTLRGRGGNISATTSSPQQPNESLFTDGDFSSDGRELWVTTSAGSIQKYDVSDMSRITV